MTPLTEQECPVCGSSETVVSDRSSETICASCGVVLQSLVLAHTVSFAEIKGQRGVVVPTDAIPMGSLTPAKFKQAVKYSLTSIESNLTKAMRELKTIASQLRCGTDTLRRAAQIYQDALYSPKLVKQKIVPLVAASLYAAYRTKGLFVFDMDIANVTNITVKVLHKYSRKLQQSLELLFKREVPSSIIFYFYNNFEKEIEPTSKAYSYQILKEAQSKHEHIFSSAKMRSIASACVYIALKRRYEDSVTLEDVANVLRINLKSTHRNVATLRKAIGDERLEKLYKDSLKLGL